MACETAWRAELDRNRAMRRLIVARGSSVKRMKKPRRVPGFCEDCVILRMRVGVGVEA